MDLKSELAFLRTCWILMLNFYWIDQYSAARTFGTSYGGTRINGCPKPCVCETRFKVECIGKNLTKIPENLPNTVTHLDLSSNKISVLPDLKKFRNLEELRLAGNLLSHLSDSTFHGLTRLHTLQLQGNRFKQVPEGAFQSLLGIKDLYFDANEITHVPENSFRNMRGLIRLRLDANYLTDVPVEALKHIRSLQALDLSTNKIKSIPNFAFRNLSNLIVLMLHDNQISQIADHAFEGLNVLDVLDLQANKVKRMPAALTSLTDLRDLNIGDNYIGYIPDNSFSGNKKLELLRLKDNPITSVEKNAFRQLPYLTDLILSEVSNMEHFPDLNGTYNLKTIRFDRASIQSIPTDLCQKVFHLQTLDMHSNNIQKLPNLSRCTSLKILNLGNNEITTLEEGLFSNVSELRDLTISNNRITHISSKAFIGLGKLEYLDLSHNKIADIKDDAFVPLQALKDLNLGENDFPHLPTKGLVNLEHLKTFHNKNLQERIPASQLPKVQTLVLSYAYHCCDFTKNSKEAKIDFKEEVTWLTSKPDIVDIFNSSLMEHTGNFTDLDSITREIEHFRDQEMYYDMNHNMHEYIDPDYGDTIPQADNELVNIVPISCEPMPGPFLPCDELFGWWSLRCGVWIVFLFAVLGNGIVLFVSISGRSKMDVPRFLICNLACADFCMGIYLGILAIVDASTLGEFEIHAIKWQKSPGCLVAGFLGIVSSELSVFTLTIITMERFYAIKHAMRFNKRLSLKHAVYVMLGGWFFCLVLASLPLFEISDYRKFAICLPFETGDRASLAYVCFIMFFNGISFIIIVGCYIKMYVSIILGPQSCNSKDFRVAKRMALLVFTDFLCWAPIIFFSVTAALGKDLIGLNIAKVLTIFVLPLNSCANPFLYAIFTKQFKKDCVKLCKRIEESSISRSLTNSTGRRLSFGISTWRNSHLHSPFHTEKRGSCSNSVSASSSIGGVVNQTEDGECQLYDRDNYIVKEIAEDNSENENIIENTNSPKNNESAHNSCTDLIQKSECECCHSKTRKLSVGPMGSDTQIVIHFDKKGNALSTEKSAKDKKCVRCKKCNKKVQKRKSPKHSAYEHSRDSDVTYTKSKESVNYCSQADDQVQNIENHQPKETCDEKLLKKADDMSHGKVKGEIVTQVQLHNNTILTKEKKELLRLPKSSEKRDKTMHINEWRKSSHLPCLWRNSLDLDSNMPKYKSNSLADLPRSPIGFDGSPGKRRSLSSRHEGYLLRKNSNRDSAYEDEEEMIEYQDCKSLSAEQCRHLTPKHLNDTTDAFKITHSLKRQERIDSQSADSEEKLELLGPTTKVTRPSSKRGSDKESGISSENFFTGD